MPQHLSSFICQLPARHETHMPHCFRAMAKGSSTYTAINRVARPPLAFSLGASTSLATGYEGNNIPQAVPVALCTSTQCVGPAQATTPGIGTIKNSLVGG